jgi:4-aminobutyrate aminotransferase/(S)-3-amino-2-methylpropionate transaminase
MSEEQRAGRGAEPPRMVTTPAGPESQRWAARLDRVEYPANAARREAREGASGVAQWPIIYAEGHGANVIDVDGNRYVDLTAGFGALLLGHDDAAIEQAIGGQQRRLWHALGDVYSSDTKVRLLERLAALHPARGARVMLGQSGSDAVSAALKTARLATGRAGAVAFRGGYHGLSYGPLSVCGYRESFRAPFADQLNPHVHFAPYPAREPEIAAALAAVARLLAAGDVGAVVVEPILGRGGCVPAAPGFLGRLATLTREAGALLVVDEIWTGLGRSGRLLACSDEGVVPDLLCLGKGLGGGLPLAACVGTEEAMDGWRKGRGDLVHTATFHGAPLACAASLALLDALADRDLVARADHVGAAWRGQIAEALGGHPDFVEVRGAGLMVGIELASTRVAAATGRALLEQGYITLGGGRDYEALTLTPPLTIAEPLLAGFTRALAAALGQPA